MLAEGSGPAAGNTTSYCAEAYGMHAGILFLSLLSEFTNKQFTSIEILCDNQSLIKKAQQRFEYNQPFPTSTTEAEWDQIESAHQILRTMNLDPTFTHVKGHQDDTTNLDFRAILNIV